MTTISALLKPLPSDIAMSGAAVPAVMPVYRRSSLAIVRGEGVYLYAEDGRRYLDFASGIAVNSLGHCHPHLVAALKEQAETLWHCSNMFTQPEQVRLAERLVQATFADSVFFCSTGVEAVECGIKMMRKYHDETGNPGRYRIITLENGFHGRSLTAISASKRDYVTKGYAPLVEGFDQVPLNDMAALEAAITEETAGFLMETIQGEGGVRPCSIEFLQKARELADRHGLLLFLDEVQCGMGRTGRLFAFEQAGITPDICSVAKGIGGGFPLGACLATQKVARVMTPGSHGSTYGGNPMGMKVGNAVLDILLTEGFFEQVARRGERLKAELERVAERFPHLIREVRGAGLMLALVMAVPNREFSDRLRDAGLITAPVVGDVIRIFPPLILEDNHIDEAVSLITQLCEVW
jgi:acetylornithine/N-succinyldiaminopimelate aminotransferase